MTKLDKAAKLLGVDTVKELEAKSAQELKESIVMSSRAMAEAKEDLENNPQYQELKENLKALSLGYKEVSARQKAIILVAISLLGAKGE